MRPRGRGQSMPDTAGRAIPAQRCYKIMLEIIIGVGATRQRLRVNPAVDPTKNHSVNGTLSVIYWITKLYDITSLLTER